MGRKKRTGIDEKEEMKDLLKEIKSEDLLKYKIEIKCKNEKQKKFLEALKDKNNQICFGIGSAAENAVLRSKPCCLSCAAVWFPERGRLVVAPPYRDRFFR